MLTSRPPLQSLQGGPTATSLQSPSLVYAGQSQLAPRPCRPLQACWASQAVCCALWASVQGLTGWLGGRALARHQLPQQGSRLQPPPAGGHLSPGWLYSERRRSMISCRSRWLASLSSAVVAPVMRGVVGVAGLGLGCWAGAGAWADAGPGGRAAGLVTACALPSSSSFPSLYPPHPPPPTHR